MTDDGVYRFYDSQPTDSINRKCQNVNGWANDKVNDRAPYSCWHYEQGGAVGPVVCDDNGPAAYNRIAADGFEGGAVHCHVFTEPGCQGQVWSMAAELSTKDSCRGDIPAFASFKCVSFFFLPFPLYLLRGHFWFCFHASLLGQLTNLDV